MVLTEVAADTSVDEIRSLSTANFEVADELGSFA
jgi:acyl CoA:acetate/3-ketoacid CoA transferase beta subunit